MNTRDVLSALIGLPFLEAGRAGDLQWFHFGSWHEIRDFFGSEKKVGDFALHIQCPWRILNEDQILAGSGDRTIAKNDLVEFDNTLDLPGNNILDINTVNFCQMFGEGKASVKEASIDGHGGITIRFSSKCSLEVFPDTSSEEECWRLIKFEKEDSTHFVFPEDFCE